MEALPNHLHKLKSQEKGKILKKHNTKDPLLQHKDLPEIHNIKFISRVVVGLKKSKGKFNAFEDRRMLLKENDLF